MSEMIMLLHLPVPPEDNHLYITKRPVSGADGRMHSGGRARTPEYRQYIQEVWAMVRSETTPQQRDALGASTGPLMLVVRVRFPVNGRVHDTGNTIKSLGDALKVALEIDDERFEEWSIRRLRSEGPPECAVLILPMRDDAQEGL